MRYIVQTTIRGFNYYLKIDGRGGRRKYMFEGLKDNATIFSSKERADYYKRVMPQHDDNKTINAW